MIAVIGSGISGMSFSHYCTLNGHNVKVFEKSSTMGGCIESWSLGDLHYAELGGHTLTNTYRSIIEIIEYYNKQNDIVPASKFRADLLDGDNLASPLQKVHIWELLISIPRMLLAGKERDSIEEYYSNILGKDNYSGLFRHLFQAILCQNPDVFPAKLLFRKRASNRSYPKKFTLASGMAQLFTMMRTNPRIQLNLATDVTAITKNKSYYTIWNGKEKLTEVRYLNFSCPSDTAAQLLEHIEPELAEKLKSIQIAHIETVLIEIDRKQAGYVKRKNIIALQQVFYSAIQYVHEQKEYWVFHFKPDQCDVNGKIQTIGKVLNIDPNSVKVLHRKRSVLPALKVSDLDTIEWIKSYIADKPLFFSSNFVEGLSIEDCCLRAYSESRRLQALQCS